jgi:hypothetical protein
MRSLSVSYEKNETKLHIPIIMAHIGDTYGSLPNAAQKTAMDIAM